MYFYNKKIRDLILKNVINRKFALSKFLNRLYNKMDKESDHKQSIPENFYLPLLHEDECIKWKFYEFKNF